ncbi:MAG: type II secretion system protein GspN [bacterium]
MNPMLQKALKGVGYSTYGLVICILSIYLFFPNERLRQLVVEQIDSDGRYNVTVQSAGLAFPPGVKAEGIKIISPPEKPGDKPGRLYIDKAVFTPSLLSLLGDEKRFTLEVEAIGGTFEVEVASKGRAKKFKIKFSKLSMGKLPGIAKAISLPMTGTLSGSGHLNIPAEGLRRAEGKFTLGCKSCTLGDGKTKVKMDFRPKHLQKKVPNLMATQGVTLPRVRLGRFGGDIVIERGKATFQQFEALSPDGEAVLMGFITLRDPFPFSNVDAYFKFKFDQELKTREPKWTGIEAGLAQGRRADQHFGFSVRGRLKDPPQFRPARYSSVERHYKDDKSGRGGRGRARGRGAMSPRAIMRPRVMRPPRAKRPPKTIRPKPKPLR